jgi:DNA-binding transcriptional MerR regulator
MKKKLHEKLGSKIPLDSKLHETLMEKKYTVKDLQELNREFTYKTINHWSGKGYLLSETQEKSWRKFSFADYIWLLFLNELREMDVSIKRILSSVFVEWGIPERELVEMDAIKIEKLKAQEIKDIIPFIDRSLVLETFCWRLVELISYKNKLSLRFYKNGSIKPIYGNVSYHGIVLKPDVEQYNQEVKESNLVSSITVSIDSLIKDYISSKDLDNISDNNLLSKEEIQILEQIRNGEVKEITIYFEDGKPQRLELVDDFVNIDTSKRVKELFISDYQSCRVITSGGKAFSIERTISKKLA